MPTHEKNFWSLKNMRNWNGIDYRVKEVGVLIQIELWGTPADRSDGSDKRDPIEPIFVVFCRYDDSCFKDRPDIPKYEKSLDKRMLWSMVSNAAERSSRAKAKIFLLFMRIILDMKWSSSNIMEKVICRLKWR